jgi:adenosylmethionine-8-amino-7-oxononanoate aminotransferase
VANLGVWRDEPVQARIDTLAARQGEGAAMLSGVKGIGNVRQCGTILALDYDVPQGAISPPATAPFGLFRERGLLIRPWATRPI